MLAKATLSPDEARSLTDKIKARSEELWHLLLEAYEGGAHTALGYSSWGAYFEAEYGGSKSRAYQLIDAGRVARAIEGQSKNLDSIPNDLVARELSPLAKEDAKTAGRVLDDLVEEHGDKITGSHARKAVEGVFEATEIRKELPPKTRAVIEGDQDSSMPRNPAQMRHLKNIADKRGDEKAAETAERVANGEFKSTFDAYPEAKTETKEKAKLSPPASPSEKAQKNFDSIVQRLHELAAGIDHAGGLHKVMRTWPEKNQRIFISEYRALGDRVLRQVQDYARRKV